MTTPTQPLTMSKISFTEKFPKGYAAESLIGQCEIEANKQMQLIIAAMKQQQEQQEQDAIGFLKYFTANARFEFDGAKQKHVLEFWKEQCQIWMPVSFNELYQHYLREKQKGESK